MRIVFLGTSDFAVATLDTLASRDRSAAAGVEVVLVVTAPSKPKGRGQVLEPPPVARRALELGLPLEQPMRINAPESLARIEAARPDLVVVVAYGQILGQRLLALAPRGAVNLHGSLLPRFRGAAPIARAIQSGERTTGVTLQFMARQLDAGDVVASESMAILPDEDAGQLSARMSDVAAELLLRNLAGLGEGTAPRVPQDHALATLAPKLEKSEGHVEFAIPCRAVHDHVRAMTPWPGAFTDLHAGAVREGSAEPTRVVLRRTEPLEDAPSSAAPGTIVRAERAIDVATASGLIRIHRLLKAGKREMSAEEFLRGSRIEAGARFE